MSNTELWDKVFDTDPKHTKDFQRTGGFKGTAIKPLYLTHKATELWGPMGDAWGAETAEHVISGNTVFIKARLWYPGKAGKAWVEHWGGDVLTKGKDSIPNDEAFKMAFTDAIGKCLVQLGFSADVHLGLFDGSKYVEPVNPKKPFGTAIKRNEKYAEILAAIEGAETLDQLKKVWADNNTNIKAISIEPELELRLIEAKDTKKTTIEAADVIKASHGEGFINAGSPAFLRKAQ